jgi:L-fuculose-phosphate aldolase
MYFFKNPFPDPTGPDYTVDIPRAIVMQKCGMGRSRCRPDRDSGARRRVCTDVSIDSAAIPPLQYHDMLHFDAQASESNLRVALVECGRICYDRRLLTSNDGNLSVRLAGDRVLITPAGVSKGRMSVEDILCIASDGRLTEGSLGSAPSSETPMHLEVYRQRPDVRAVIHAHPVFSTALTVAGLEFPVDILPEAALLLGGVPVTSFATPGTTEDAEAVRPLIGSHDAILLRQHGTLTCGTDLEEALLNLERLEHVAEVFWRAHALRGVGNYVVGSWQTHERTDSAGE